MELRFAAVADLNGVAGSFVVRPAWVGDAAARAEDDAVSDERVGVAAVPPRADARDGVDAAAGIDDLFDDDAGIADLVGVDLDGVVRDERDAAAAAAEEDGVGLD